MKNLFFYTRTETRPSESVEGSTSSTTPTVEVEFADSFNINKVIRTVSVEGGGMLVLLDDIHERIERINEG